MAKFSSKMNSFTPGTFKTSVKIYDQSKLSSWQYANKSALDILNEYQEKIKRGDWLSTEDRQRYKTAIDDYTSSGNALRDVSKHYGQKYTADEEKSWTDSLSSLQTGYNSVNDFYNQFASDKVYGDWKTREDSRVAYENSLKNVDINKANKGWQAYLADVEAENTKDEKWWETLGRWLGGSGGVVDTTLPMAGTTQTIHNLRDDVSHQRPKDDWTQEQKNAFGELYATSPYLAYQFAEETNNRNNAAKEENQILALEAWANKNGWNQALASVGAVGGSFFGLADALNDLTLGAAGRNYDGSGDGEISPFEASQAITGSIANNLNQYGTLPEDWWGIGGKGWGDLYALGMSRAQSIASGALLGGAGTLVNYFGQGMASGFDEAKARGATDGQAATLGVLSGAFEGLSEMIGVDRLFKIKDSKTLSGLLLNVLKQAGAEGIEEGITTTLNLAADNFIMQDRSQFAYDVAAYMNAGFSEKEAKSKAWGKATGDIFADTLGGAISGGMGGGVSTIGQTIKENANAKKSYSGQAMQLTDDAVNSLDPEVAAVGNKMQQKLDKGKNLSGWNLNQLLDVTDTSKIRTAVESRLTELGETGDVSAIADVIARQTAGEDISFKDKNIVKGSKFAERVANELNRDNIQSGQYSSAWAEGIGTKRVNADVYNKGISESQRLVAKAAQEMTSRVKGFTAEAASAMVKGYDGTQNPSEYIKNFKNSFEIGRDRGELSGETNSAMKVAYVIGQTEAERVANLSESEASREHLAEFSKKYGDQAQAAIDAYEDGQDVVEYESGYDRAFEKAKSGLDFSYIESSEDTAYLTEAQKKAAYEAGIKYADSVARQQAENITTQTAENTVRRKGAVKGEGVKISDLRKAFNDTQNRAYKVLSRIAEATGIDIVLYKSEVDANGNYRGAQGKFKWSNDKIYIDLNAGLNNVKDTGSLANYTMLRTFSHEFSHFIEKHDPMMYNELRRTVFSELTARGSNVEALIAAKQGDMDIDNASREVVAEALTDILPDSHFVEILAQKNPSALKKISTKLKEFVSNVKSYFASIKPNSAIEAKALKEERDGVVQYVQSIIDAFDKAAVSAVENYQRTKADSNSTTSNDKIQEQRRKVPPRDEFATNAMIWAHSDRTEVGEKKLFYRKGKWVLLEKTDNGFVEMGTYTDKQRNEILKEIEVYNETIREDLYTCIMRHEAVGRNDMRDYGDDGRKQAGDGRGGSIHQGESNSDRSGSNESGESGNRNQVDEEQHQEREEFSLDNRSLLVNALDSVAQNPMESKKLSEYRANIKGLNEQSEKLVELKSELKELSFSKGPRDMARIKELRAEIVKTENRINLYDKRLLNLEATKALRDVITRETQKAYKKAEQKGKEALKLQRERAESKLNETRKQYKEARAKNVEGRNKTAERRAILGIATELDKLLNKGTKEKNVKKGAAGLVRSALDLSDMLFATDDEILLNGIGTDYTTAEAVAMDAYKELYEEYHSYDNAVTENKARRAELRSQMNDLKSEFSGVLERERNRINEAQASDTYDALINAYKELQNSKDSFIKQTFDNDTLAHLEKMKEDVGKTTVKEMTLSQLKEVHKAFTMIKTMVQRSNRLFIEEGKATVKEKGEEAIREISAKGHKKSFGEVEKWFSTLSLNNLKPIYLMERTSSKVLQREFQKVLDGESVWATDMAEAKAFLDGEKAKHGYEKWNLDKTVTFNNNTGQEFALTLGDMMTIYAYTKRGEQALEHLRTDGFVFDESRKVKGKFGIEREINDKTAYKISDDLLFKILGTLTKEQKAYVDATQKYLSDVMGSKGNEVSTKLLGIDLFTEENYLPIRSEGAYLERVREQNAGEAKIKNKGFTKPTQKNARNAIVLENYNKLWTEHVAEMSSYHAFTLPLEDFYRVYNYQNSSDAEVNKAGVIPALDNAYGKAMTDAIDQLLKDLNGGARSDPRESGFKKLLSLHKKAKVMASLSVVVQQPSALFRAQAIIDPKFFIGKKIGKEKHKALWNEVKTYAPVAVIKDMGHFDVGMGKASADWLLDEKSLMDKITDIASKPASYADEVTWVAIWNAVKLETANKNPKLNTSSKEFLTLAGKRFEDVIRHTQVYDSTLARSGNMRSKSGLMQMVTSFMAEPTTSINMREMALRSGDKARIVRTTAAVYASTLINAILVALPYAMRDDDEDETFVEKYISALTTSFVDNINPITALPFFKDVWSLARGYDVERTDMSLVDDLLSSIEKLGKSVIAEEKEAGEITDNAVKVFGDLASLLGLPVDNVYRDVMSFVNFGKTITGDIKGMDTTWKSIEDALQESFRTALPGLGLTKAENKSKKLYDAIMAGDEKYVARFKNEYVEKYSDIVDAKEREKKITSAYESALRAALRNNDPRLEEAALAKLEGDDDTYWDLFLDVVEEGKFEDKLIKAAFEAEYNYHNTKKKEAEERGETYP